ncbi:MAG: BACON domain-containing protein [Flavobacteriaceae bacterium]|nr:BACON domain-containing protein [Flavobacteriaceae bacterium]
MKKIIFILILVLIAPVMFGQEDYYGNTLSSNMYTASQILGNPTIQPPDVAAFQKVNFVPVSNYTGRVNIGIPIYEISAGSMNVPISISYNSSGVKVSDMASSVGLNWSLNAGGVISRMIKGIDDFLVPASSGTPEPYMTPSGWLGYLHPYVSSHPLNRYNDAEPDLFVVNAPGLSTKYVHSRHYSKESYPYSGVHLYGTDPEPIELEQQGNIIDETIGIITKSYINHINNPATTHQLGPSNVDITSTNGIVYSFATPDISQYYSGIGPIIYKVESSRLDQMFDPSTNQTITFEYEQYSNYFYDEMNVGVTSYGGGTYLEVNHAPHTVYPITQRLKKIVFDGGFVEFIYGLNRLDNTGDKPLIEIKINNNYGVITKHIKFAHSYFQSSISSSTPESSKRLRLDRVYEVDANLNELPGHEFTYDTSFEMPPRDSYAHDFLGYNNGSYDVSLTNPTPKYYFENNKVSPFYNSSAIELTGNYSLEANQSYAKTYSLTKITFPTGGSNEYEYGLNEFNYFGIKQGGGLRVNSQILKDGNGNEQILDYTYSNGSIARMPTYAVFRLKQGTLGNPTTLSELTNYLGIDTFMTPRSQVEFTQGSFVGYGEVTVEDRIDNGYTKYYYKSPYPYSNLSPTITYPYEYNNWPDHSYSNSWSVICPNTLSVDRDFLRGKIISESIYNKNGKLRLQKSYNYSYKEFSNISLEYYNKSSSNSTCYNDGIYISSYYNSGECGGYVEKIDLPIVRDLLTTITTSDYQSDELVTPQGAFENIQHTFKTTQTYSYDLQYPLLIKESKEVTICEETTQGGQECAPVYQDYDHQVSKEITYPLLGGITTQDNTVSTLPFASQLIAKNRLSTPLRIEFKNKDSQILAQEDHIYKDFSGNVLALEKVNFISRESSVVPSEIITKRDAQGHIIEYQKKNGIYVSRIYGYDGIHLIAEVIGSNWLNTNLKLQNLETPYDQGTTANDVDIRALMSELRVELPETSITSYTYDPLIGVTSITDPSGYISYYVYDDFNRLQYIKNKDGVVLKSYKYHYQGQADPDAIVEYTITSTTNGNGTVTVPATINEGDDLQVSINPDTNYEITSIKVNNVVQPISTSFTIENVTSNLTIDVEFSLISNITVSYIIDGGTNGTVSVSPSVVSYGGSTTVTLTPDSGYQVEYVKVGTTSYTVINNTATITNITADIDVHVSFIALSLTVSPTSLSFNFIDGNITIFVTASGSWTVSKSDSWIIISTTTGNGNGTFTVRPLKNFGLLRRGKVTVSNGSTTKLISIEQEGDEMF